MSISNSRQARKEAQRKNEINNDYYTNYFSDFFNNSVEIENAPLIPSNLNSESKIELPKRYLLKILRENGAIAYDKLTGLFLRFTERLYDVYGLPLKYNLYGYNGFISERDPDDVVILRANDTKYAIQEYIDIQARKLVNIDNAIEQNLDAIRTMTIVQAPDDRSMMSLINMNESRRVGASVIFSTLTPKGTAFSVSSTGAQFLGDKLMTMRSQILKETMSNLGFSVTNDEKRERVQSTEIDTLNLHGKDALNVLIDTFNYDAEFGGLDIRLKANTELTNTSEKENKETNDDNL